MRFDPLRRRRVGVLQEASVVGLRVSRGTAGERRRAGESVEGPHGPLGPVSARRVSPTVPEMAAVRSVCFERDNRVLLSSVVIF